MATKHVIQIEVTSNSDDAAVRQFETALQNLNATSTKAKGGMASLAGTIKDALGGAIASLVGMGAFIKFLHDGMTAAIAEERTLRVLSDTAKRFGQDGQEAAAAAQALGNALQKVGFDGDEIVKGVQQLLSVTRDYKTAVSAAGLAADIAAQRNIPYAETLGMIEDLLSGRDRGVVFAMAKLGISATTAQDALFKLDGTYRGYAATLNDSKAQIDGALGQVKDFGKELAGPLIQGLLLVIKYLRLLGLGLKEVWQAVDTTGAAIETLGVSLWKLATKGLSAAGAEWKKFGQETKADWVALQAELSALWDTSIKKAGDMARLGRIALAASHKTGDEGTGERSDYIKDAQERERKRTEALKIALDQRRALIANFNKWVREQESASDSEREALTKGFYAWQRAEDSKGQIDHAANEAMWTEIERENAAARVKIAQTEAQLKLEQQQMVANGLTAYSSAAVALFGKHKAVAIAGAIVDTYAAAVMAYRNAQAQGAPYWVAIAVMIAAVATGMARVQQIRSTNIGSGGGSAGAPSSGPATPTVFQKPAPHTTGGGGKAPSTTTMNSTATTNVTVNALTGAQAAAALNEFEKQRRPAARRVDRSCPTRARTSMGSRRA